MRIKRLKMIRAQALSNVFVLTTLLFTACGVFAQSTPTEFAEMSLEELFELKLENDEGTELTAPHWHVNYKYMSAVFDGYLAGDSGLGNHDVLWRGISERTSSNFPLVPTVIKQRAHLLQIGYQYSNTIELFLSVPYIQQRTDHISSIENYEFFVIKTEGVGDAVVSLNYKFHESALHNWWISLGLSFPTGSIDEMGDTPRGIGNQPLPYTMQLGSGTYDFPIEFNYQHAGIHDFSVTMSAIIRSGLNNRDYRLGNRYKLLSNYRWKLSKSTKLSLGVEAHYWTPIRGEDSRISVQGDFPYAASIINPNYYGGKKIKVNTGLSYRFSHYAVTAKVGRPIYQYLNGPQPKEVWQASIQLSSAF